MLMPTADMMNSLKWRASLRWHVGYMPGASLMKRPLHGQRRQQRYCLVLRSCISWKRCLLKCLRRIEPGKGSSMQGLLLMAYLDGLWRLNPL
jgi:hypothetical protein